MSDIRIKNSYYRLPEFIDFIKTMKSTVYFFLVSAVIRKGNKVQKNNYIYEECYLDGKLVSRYSQKNMAKYLKTSQSRISICIKELEKDGFIKTIYRYVGKRKIVYYQVGIWKGSIGKSSYTEVLWFDKIFTKYTDNKLFIRNINDFLNPEHTSFNGLKAVNVDHDTATV